MTIIVSDGKIIASDSLVCAGGKDIWRDGPKFSIIRGHIVGSAGSTIWGDRFYAWLANPRRKYPLEEKAEGADGSDAMVITPGGANLHYFGDTKHPEKLGGKWAIGCGYKYARAALVLGHNAVDACWAAMQLDPHCGGRLYYAYINELRTLGNGAIQAQETSRAAVGIPPRICATGRAHDHVRNKQSGHRR